MLNKEDRFIVITIADVMTSDPRCVKADVAVEEVIAIFSKTNFAGLPVVDDAGILVGIITQYDLVTKGSGIHIPTLVKTMEQVKMINPERLILEETLAPIKKLKVGDIMNNDPLFLFGDEPIEKAVESFAEHHKVNPLIVVDKNKKVIGVLSRHDMIKILAMKELGRVVDSAYVRQRPAGDSEQVVGETLRGIKKNFLFMPKYGVGKWIALGLSLFIIGLLASFLFIVRIPDTANDVAEPLVLPESEASLVLRASEDQPIDNQKVAIDVFAKFAGEKIVIKNIVAEISFGGGLRPDKFLEPIGDEFLPDTAISSLRQNVLLLELYPAEGFIPDVGREYHLGRLEFYSDGVASEIKVGSSVPGGIGSSIMDSYGRNVLKYFSSVEINSKGRR